MCKKGLPAVWTKEKIEEAFAGFVEKNRRLPVAREMNCLLYTSDAADEL